MSRAARTLALVVGYAVATVALTWPLATRLATRLPAATHPSHRADMLLLSWVLSWDVHQLLRAPLAVFEANIFHPLRHTLAYSEAMLAEALLVLPLAPLTPAPALLHNVVLLLTFVLGAVGAHLLLRRLGAAPAAAFVGGFVFAFAPYRFWQIDRLHVLCVHWTPWLLLALDRFRARGGWRPALALAFAFLLQALASVYVAFATVLFLGLILGAGLVGGPAAARRRVVAAIGVLGATGLVVAAILLPYAIVREEMALARDPGQLVVHATMPAELGRALTAVGPYVAGKVRRGTKGGGTLGFVATALAVVGVMAGGVAARGYALLALVALVLSFGPVVVLPWVDGGWVPGPYRLLYDVVPGFDALREPRRFTAFVVAFGAIAAGLGAATLLERVRRPWLGAAILVGALVLEAGWQPLALDPAPVVARPLQVQLATAPGPGAVMVLPVGGEAREALATYGAAFHLRPLVNGYSGFRPTTADLRWRLRRFPRRAHVAFLQALGVRFVVYDTRRPTARRAPVLRRALARAAPAARVSTWGAGLLLIELEPMPARAPAPPGVALGRRPWTVRASSGMPGAAIDGDLATHWVAAVDPAAGGGWLEVDLGRPEDVVGVRLELGAHYGEHLRAWRLEASGPGRAPVVVERLVAPGPLRAYRADHRRVFVDLPLRASGVRRLRIAVPPFRSTPVHWGWRQWGIHELEIYGGVRRQRRNPTAPRSSEKPK